jgi:hypothetical protein
VAVGDEVVLFEADGQKLGLDSLFFKGRRYWCASWSI